MTTVMIDNSLSLSDENKQRIRERVDEIAVEKLSIYDFVSSLRDEITNSSASLRETAINELSAVLLQLPKETITPEIGNFLLEFLLPRVEDSGHVAAEFLVAVVQHLVLCCGKDLSHHVISLSISILYETNGVQSYAQKDRMRLFELLHYLLDRFLSEIRVIYDPSKLIVAFMRAANFERDPRCLLKIFRIFNIIARNFTLENLAEDLFELIACYYPIDYEPSDTDVGKITSEMLSVGCESCLVANAAFVPFCFQLIGEKLLDQGGDIKASDGVDEALLRLRQQLQICKFLCRACDAFARHKDNAASSEVSQVRVELENFMTAFRLIAINPAQTPDTLAETREVIAATAIALANYFSSAYDDSEKDLRFMAQDSLQNCEPFILQAEMGLTLKALIVLEAIANSSKVAAEVVISKVLYWFGILLTGMTLKNPDNWQEICEECLEVLPKWFEMAARAHDLASINEDFIKNLVDIFDAVDRLEDFCSHDKILRSKFDCARLASFGEIKSLANSPNRSKLCDHTDKLVRLALTFGTKATNSTGTEPATISSAVSFLSCYSINHFTSCVELLEPDLMEDVALLCPHSMVVLSALIHDKTSAEYILPLLFKSAFRMLESHVAGTTSDFCDAIISIVEQIAPLSSEEYVAFEKGFFALLTRLLDCFLSTDAGEFEKYFAFFQNIGLTLSESKHNQLTLFLLSCVDKEKSVVRSIWLHSIISSIFSQSKCLENVTRFVKSIVNTLSECQSPSEGGVQEAEARLKQSLIDVWFAMCVRTKQFSASDDVFDDILARILSTFCRCGETRTTVSANLWLDLEPNSSCRCGEIFSIRVAMTRARLLNDAADSIRFSTKLFEFYLSNANPCNYKECIESARNLLDFFSPTVDPRRCALKKACTLLWRQRVFCQFVPIYIDYFARIPDTNTPLKMEFLRMMEMLFRLAKSVDRSMSEELKMLMPVLTQTFRLISTNHITGVNIDKLLILDSTLELLKITATVEELHNTSDSDTSPLNVFLSVFTSTLLNKNENPEVVLRCLECLKLLAQKAATSSNFMLRRTAVGDSSNPLHVFHARVVQGTIYQTRSAKRVIRQRAANVRNLWELLQ